MKTYFLSILDSTFSAFMGFLITFILLNFYIEKPFSIIFSVCIAIPLFIIAFQKILDKEIVKKSDREKNKKIENLTYSLSLLDKNKLLNLFERAIIRFGEKTLKRKDGIFIEGKPIAVFPIFSFDGIRKTDVVRVFNSIPKSHKAYVFGDKINKDLQDFIARFDNRIEFVDGKKVYSFLEQTSSLPEQTTAQVKKPFSFSDFLGKIFKKSHSKKYLSFGILFLLMSYFVVIKVYYLCCGCIFLTFSLFCRLFSKDEVK